MSRKKSPCPSGAEEVEGGGEARRLRLPHRGFEPHARRHLAVQPAAGRPPQRFLLARPVPADGAGDSERTSKRWPASLFCAVTAAAAQSTLIRRAPWGVRADGLSPEYGHRELEATKEEEPPSLLARTSTGSFGTIDPNTGEPAELGGRRRRSSPSRRSASPSREGRRSHGELRYTSAAAAGGAGAAAGVGGRRRSGRRRGGRSPTAGRRACRRCSSRRRR